MNHLIQIMEYIAVISFSVSATICAVRKGTDAVGALILSFLTSFGGGFLRDLTLGITPHILWDNEYRILGLICICTSLVFFHLSFHKRFAEFFQVHSHDFFIDFSDAIGLSIFCVLGVEAALQTQENANVTLLIFCGCISGVGGGMLRDICCGQIPSVLCKDVYILPALCGSAFYVFTHNRLPHPLALLLSVIFIIFFRTLAILFHWNFPIPGRTVLRHRRNRKQASN